MWSTSSQSVDSRTVIYYKLIVGTRIWRILDHMSILRLVSQNMFSSLFEPFHKIDSNFCPRQVWRFLIYKEIDYYIENKGFINIVKKFWIWCYDYLKIMLRTCFHAPVPTSHPASKPFSIPSSPSFQTKQKTTGKERRPDSPVMDFHPNLNTIKTFEKYNRGIGKVTFS